MIEPYSINESMVIPCVQRGMAIQIYLNDIVSYTFQKHAYDQNVRVQRMHGYVKKYHAPLMHGVYCCNEQGTNHTLVGKAFSLSSLMHFAKRAVDIKALPYMKRYEDESDEAVRERMRNIRRIIERMWRRPR